MRPTEEILENAVVRREGCGRSGVARDLIRFIGRQNIEQCAISPGKDAAGGLAENGCVAKTCSAPPRQCAVAGDTVTKSPIHHTAAELLDCLRSPNQRNWFHQLALSCEHCKALIQLTPDLCQVIALIRVTDPGFGVVDLAALFPPTRTDLIERDHLTLLCSRHLALALFDPQHLHSDILTAFYFLLDCLAT
jgi:hypothetical protein